MYAKTMIIGHAGSDAELRTTGGGMDIATFSVAVNDKQRKDKAATWYRVVCFNKLATIASDYVTKGKMLHVEGRMKCNKWTPEGADREAERWELIADNIKLLGSSDRGTDNVRR